jgi:uncharacterized membrane protein YcjF (UPF0283 family)
MKFPHMGIVAPIVALELILVGGCMTGSANLMKLTYRERERSDAQKALVENRSAATEAAIQEELHLASVHLEQERLHTAGYLFFGFLVLDCIAICWWSQHQKGPAA